MDNMHLGLPRVKHVSDDCTRVPHAFRVPTCRFWLIVANLADYGCFSPLFGSGRLGHTPGKLTGGIGSTRKREYTFDICCGRMCAYVL